ncbi:MAG: DUF4388 domain-containing protein [Thermoleophilia bacterium]|nr:DUF4388 domain-containing protein [Thermoleophilia bacterium]
MQLEGHVQDISLPEVFRLLKMSGKTGVLEVTYGKQRGEVCFRSGEIYHATSTANGSMLGERLVRAGKLRRSELAKILAEQSLCDPPRLLGSLLEEEGLVVREVLERLVREQIEDVVFSLFGWPTAEFSFSPGPEPAVCDILVSLDPEGVIIEGSRRVDEWAMIIERLGSLEKVPYLLTPTTAGMLTLQPHEWDTICFIDGRRDINTIMADSGFDRFRTAKVIFSLMNAGLVATRDPTLELLGQTSAIALRGPIDVYNLTFLNAACGSEVSSHLRLEEIEGEEVELHLSAGVREHDGQGLLIYAPESRMPKTIWRRMALETSGFVLLVNINSSDSVVVSRDDVALMTEIGDRPYVVATYASMADEKIEEHQVRELLELPGTVPVVHCGLRDPAAVDAVIGALLRLLP